MLLDKKALFSTKEQELLLQAALMQGDDAITAWEQWKNMADLEGHPDNGSFRLLPLLYTNMRRLGIDHPYMNRLRGIYRQTWYKNQRLVYDMSKVLRYLHEAGIQTMVLKGGSLAILHYRNVGVRPMADIDILVPVSQVLLTLDLLKKNGWMPTTDLTDEDLRYRHSKQFKDSFGREFDLHWHLLFDSCWEGADDDFWKGAVPLTFGEVSTLSPNPTDMLLHIIVHGVKWNPEPPIRWIADAITLINESDPAINWIRFIDQAKTHRLVLHIKKALNYLRDTYKTPIPISVIDTIHRLPISLMDFLEYKYSVMNLEPHCNSFQESIIGGFPMYFMEYRRIHHSAGFFSLIRGIPKYLQYRMQKKNLYDLISYLSLRCIRITKRKLLSGLKADNA